MITADRPARDMAQIVVAIVERLTMVPGAEVTLRLEIDAEVPSGLDRSTVRTLTENAATLGFIGQGDQLITLSSRLKFQYKQHVDCRVKQWQLHERIAHSCLR